MELTKLFVALVGNFFACVLGRGSNYLELDYPGYNSNSNGGSSRTSAVGASSVYNAYSGGGGYDSYQSPIPNNKYSAAIQASSKYEFKCYSCEDRDPNGDCSNGKLYPETHVTTVCTGFCYVMKYTLYGTEERTTQRSCVPNGRCSSTAGLCQSSYVNCDFACCDSEFCNAGTSLYPRSLLLSLPLFSSLFFFAHSALLRILSTT